MAANRVIGRDAGLPWRLPADLEYFKRVTIGYPVIMGRKTHESIGRALPQRVNIIVTRQENYIARRCEIAGSLSEAFTLSGEAEEVMVIGGASLYREALPLAGRIYLTEVQAEPKGDTFFPEFDRESWREVARESHSADDENELPFSFVTLDRIARG